MDKMYCISRLYIVSISCFALMFLTTLLASCNNTDAENTPSKPNVNHISITHFNVIIAPDLSNRLTVHKKPVSDLDIIDSLLEAAYPKIATYRRKMHQMDRYRVDIINDKHFQLFGINGGNLVIDFGRFESQNDRINYLAPFDSLSQFKEDKKLLKQELSKLISKVKETTTGSDIWTYLNSGLDRNKIDTTIRIIPFSNDTYENTYKNVLVLLTDGYLESSNDFSNGKKKTSLTQSLINEFRIDYITNGQGQSMREFFTKNGYGIIPVENPLLNYTEIIVLEMYDRSTGAAGATKNPTDLQIIKLFWDDWFKKSGVKNYTFVSTVPTVNEAKKIVLQFIGVK